jgi:hypothetical protein
MDDTHQPASPQPTPASPRKRFWLPYMEQTNLYQSLNSNLAIDDPINRPLRTVELSSMKCPSDGHN